MRTVILAAIGGLFAIGSIAKSDEPQGPQPSALTVKVKGMLAAAGQAGVQQFGTQEELNKAVGPAVVDLGRPIDYAKEDVVLVGWGTSGPPFGQLKFTSSAKEGVRFYVQEPNVQVRGQAFKLGADWFAVPKGTQVTFGKGKP